MKLMKVMLILLALMVALPFGTIAVAQDWGGDASTMATMTLTELIAMSELQTGPITLDIDAGDSSVLQSSLTMMFGKSPIIPVTLDIAAEAGNGGELGELKLLNVNTVSKIQVDRLRYSVERSEDGKSLYVMIVLDIAQDGEERYVADSVTLTRGGDDGSTLLIEKRAEEPTVRMKN